VAFIQFMGFVFFGVHCHFQQFICYFLTTRLYEETHLDSYSNLLSETPAMSRRLKTFTVHLKLVSDRIPDVSNMRLEILFIFNNSAVVAQFSYFIFVYITSTLVDLFSGGCPVIIRKT